MALLLAAPALAGCGDAGDARYAGLSVHDAPAGEYRARYLDPPWYVLREEGTTLVLKIDPTALPGDAGVPAKYLLTVTVESGSARARADADAASAPSRSEMLVTGVSPIETDSGDDGFDVLTTRLGDGRRFRYVSLALDASRVVRLVFEANPPLDEPGIDSMVRSFDVAPGRP